MRLGAPFTWDTQQGGLAAITDGGDPLPQALLDSIRRTRLALKGPLTTPVGGGFRSVNVRLREEFELYANVRPARTIMPGGRYDDIDLVLIRENIEGLYVGVRALHPDRRRSARRRAGLGREHARGLPPHRQVRVRLRGEERPQEGHDRPQGERDEGR